MKYIVKFMTRDDLFLHKEHIFDKYEDFYSFVTYWFRRGSDFKCMHIYFKEFNENCEEEKE